MHKLTKKMGEISLNVSSVSALAHRMQSCLTLDDAHGLNGGLDFDATITCTPLGDVKADIPEADEAKTITKSASPQRVEELVIRSGYIKEMIEPNGLGLVFSMESGPALFSCQHVWIDGVLIDPDDAHRLIPVGDTVDFVLKVFENSDGGTPKSEMEKLEPRGEAMHHYSPALFLQQAVAIWKGSKPEDIEQLMQNPNHMDELRYNRRKFNNYYFEDRFVVMDLVRCDGEIVGYLNSDFGVIKQSNAGCCRLVVFHTSDVYFFRKPLDLKGRDIFRILPVGIRVRFDARFAHSKSFREIGYQACAVFVGRWPSVPHPTLLRGGPGSYSQCYQVQTGHSFFYLEIGVRQNLDQKLAVVEWMFPNRNGDFISTYFMPTARIKSSRDYLLWKDSCVPERFKIFTTGRRSSVKKRNYHVFGPMSGGSASDRRSRQLE